MLKPKITDENGEGYYLFHTLCGYYPPKHFELYQRNTKKHIVIFPGSSKSTRSGNERMME